MGLWPWQCRKNQNSMSISSQPSYGHNVRYIITIITHCCITAIWDRPVKPWENGYKSCCQDYDIRITLPAQRIFRQSICAAGGLIKIIVWDRLNNFFHQSSPIRPAHSVWVWIRADPRQILPNLLNNFLAFWHRQVAPLSRQKKITPSSLCKQQFPISLKAFNSSIVIIFP